MGKPIASHQLIAGYLADMETKCEAARGLLYKIGQLVDEDAPELTKYSAMAKLFCTRCRDGGHDARPSRSSAATGTCRSTRSSA